MTDRPARDRDALEPVPAGAPLPFGPAELEILRHSEHAALLARAKELAAEARERIAARESGRAVVEPSFWSGLREVAARARQQFASRLLALPSARSSSQGCSCPGCDEESCAGHGDSRPAAFCHACQEAGCTVERWHCAPDELF